MKLDKSRDGCIHSLYRLDEMIKPISAISLWHHGTRLNPVTSFAMLALLDPLQLLGTSPSMFSFCSPRRSSGLLEGFLCLVMIAKHTGMMTTP